MKIEAARLLLDNTDNTFVTPVFNGSASLRNAAGQLIEETTKSTRRKQTVDDAYIQELYSEMTSLYRLDQIVRKEVSDTPEAAVSTSTGFGPLPAESVMLLSSLALCWLGILSYVAVDAWRKKKSQK